MCAARYAKLRMAFWSHPMTDDQSILTVFLYCWVLECGLDGSLEGGGLLLKLIIFTGGSLSAAMHAAAGARAAGGRQMSRDLVAGAIVAAVRCIYLPGRRCDVHDRHVGRLVYVCL